MSQIENVSDTARWVAVYRAMETVRPDAVFRDPFADRLAGSQGRAIVDAMKRGRAMAWAMIVRTKVLDEIILDRVRNGGVDQVVNLACGLDARAWRMTELPPTLRWVDVDLPGILEHKLGLLEDEKTVCRYEAVKVDLRDAGKRQALFSQLAAQSSRTLVVSEGLLIYLAPEQVADLAHDLNAAPSFRWWAFDIASPRLLAMMTKLWGRSVNAGNAPFRFAPAEGTAFFAPLGWKEMEFHSTMDDARRLQRTPPMLGFWRFMMRFATARRKAEMHRFSGIALLERA